MNEFLIVETFGHAVMVGIVLGFTYSILWYAFSRK